MRKFAKNGDISVQAIAGTHAVLLGMDATKEAAKGLLGFAIHRTDHTEDEAYWLRGMLTFEENDHETESYSVFEHPIQDFTWGDYTAKPNYDYTYKIVPVYGKPKHLQHGEPVAVTVQTESEADSVHRIFFNRGVAASQAFERKFGEPTLKDLQKPGSPALVWLSRGLEEGMLSFISAAKGKGWGLHASLYEFTYQPVLKAFQDARARGVDVKLVVDDHGKTIQEENRPAIEKAKIKSLIIPRDGVGQGISHNKFIVLLKNNKPVAVWTGSTNVTMGGIFGQSNVGHSVWDAGVAATYLQYWNEISTNPSHKVFAPWDDSQTPVNSDAKKLPPIQVIFSPRGSLEALNYYASLMDSAQSSVFLTAAFGVSNEFTAVLVKKKPYLRYLLMDNKGQTSNVKNFYAVSKNPFNRIALGAVMPGGVLENWHKENLVPGLNSYVKYVHTKYMLIDPLSDNPTVISGSANFSEASTEKNDENMLLIRGDTRVADVYLCEFMRLFSHFYFRDQVEQAVKKKDDSKPRKLYLRSDDSWTVKFYKPGSAREKERLYFAGKAG